MLLKCLGSVFGTGKGHQVLTRQVIEQIANATADQLERTFRQNARLDDGVDHPFG